MEQLHGKEHILSEYLLETSSMVLDLDREICVLFHGTCFICNSREFGWYYDSIVSFVSEEPSTIEKKNYERD